MKLKCNISILRIVSISFILAIIFSLFSSSINVHAKDGAESTGKYEPTLVEAEFSDGAYSSSNAKWYATYMANGGYKGQGVLLYLLERDGGGPVAGTTPKAYACSKQMFGYELYATDKYGRYSSPVTKWESSGGNYVMPYWAGSAGRAQNGGFMIDSVMSNTAAIKAWLKTPLTTTNGEQATNGISMVKTIWGEDIAKRFTNEEIVLVAEPIVAAQFGQRFRSTNLDFNDNMTIEGKIASIKFFKVNISYNTHSVISPDLMTLLNDTIEMYETWQSQIGKVPGTVSESQRLAIISQLEKVKTVSRPWFYWPLGEVKAGTSKDVLNYYNSLQIDQLGLKNTVWEKSELGVYYTRMQSNACTYVETGSVVCANTNFNLWPYGKDALRKCQSADYILSKKYSFGMLAMLAFTDDGTPCQTTYDETKGNNPDKPADESKGYCTIIKSYRDTNLTTGLQKHVGTYYRKQVADLITIENEPIYKVIGWKESNTADLDISSIGWETNVPGLINKTGTGPATTTLPSTHRYLYVLLEKNETEPGLDANYTLSQSSITRHIDLNHPDKRTIGSGATASTMNNLYNKTFYWWVPAHTTTCGKHDYKCPSPDDSPSGCNNKKDKSCTCDYCGGCSTDHNGTAEGNGCTTSHSSSCEHDEWTCGGHQDECTGWKWKNQDLKFGLKGTSSDDYVVATASKYRVVSVGSSVIPWTKEYNRTATYAYNETKSGLNFHGLVHRGYTQIVLADWKNTATLGDEVKNDLVSLSNKNYSYSNSISASRPNRKTSNYTADFTIKFEDDSANKDTTYGPSIDAPHSKEQCRDNTKYTVLTTTDYTVKSKLAVLVYLGKETIEPNNDVPDTFMKYYDFNKLYVSGVAVPVGSVDNFRPYVEMKYDDLVENDKTAYVLGEHTRSLNFYAFGEVEWKKAEVPNLTLSSLQWSTHATAKKNHISGTVLPGGATLTLTIAKDARQVVNVRSYQPILAGAGEDQVTNTGGTNNLKTQNAADEHEKFVDSVVESLSNMHVGQYILDTDTVTDTNYGGDRSLAQDVFEDGGLVDNNVVWEGLGGSAESKYYFNNDTDSGNNSDSAEGDLDAVAGETSVMYYTFWCDTSGNIRFASGTNLDTVSNAPNNSAYDNESTIICKRIPGTPDCEWTSNATVELRDLDNKTYVVRRLVQGLEKAGGSDASATWVTDGKWYNEAFDGITYAIYTTQVTTGFSTPAERITVLDPKLCPVNTGKSDLFTKFNTTQIKMNSASDITVGSFIGSDVPMMNADMFYWSREFYVPNVTTQDLH